MDKKLICFDVDGTIISYNGEAHIPQGTIDAIKKLKEKGHILALATGRDYLMVKYIIDMFNINYAILHNGAHIIFENKSIFEKRLGTRNTIRLLNELKKRHYGIIAYDGEKVYLNKTFNGARGFIEKESGRTDIVKTDSSIKTNLFNIVTIGDINEISHFTKTQKILKLSDNHYDILSKDVSKGRSLKRIVKLLNVKRDDIITVGDEVNDIDMLKYAGIGIAVGNACDKLKEVADIVADDIDNNGIYKVFETLKLI